MSAPLRLRLRVVKPELANPHLYHVVVALPGEPPSYRGEPAVLEFENPINGSWHPVEVVQELV